MRPGRQSLQKLLRMTREQDPRHRSMLLQKTGLAKRENNLTWRQRRYVSYLDHRFTVQKNLHGQKNTLSHRSRVEKPGLLRLCHESSPSATLSSPGHSGIAGWCIAPCNADGMLVLQPKNLLPFGSTEMVWNGDASVLYWLVVNNG